MKLILALAVLLSPLGVRADDEEPVEESAPPAQTERIEGGGSAVGGAGMTAGAKDGTSGASTPRTGTGSGTGIGSAASSGSGAGTGSAAAPAGCKVAEVNWNRQINFVPNPVRGTLPMQSVKGDAVIAYKVTAKYIGKGAHINTFVPQFPHELAFSTRPCDFKPANRQCAKAASVFGELQLPVTFDGRGCSPPKADVYYVNFRWAKAERQGQTLETCPKNQTCKFALRFD